MIDVHIERPGHRPVLVSRIADPDRVGDCVPAEDLPYVRMDARQVASARLVKALDRAGEMLKAGYPRAEVDSWPAKMAEARARRNGGKAAVMLQTEADALGVPVDDLAAKIIARGERFEVAAAKISALRQKAQAEIDAAENPEAIAAALENALASLADISVT